MRRLFVCVYAICKDESAFVDRWMDSMGEADRVCVTDTGSSDDTRERLRARGAEVFEERIEPWRFDAARNLSLSHVPEDADICVCTDLDEVFRPGWRALLEDTWQPDTKKGKYIFNWSLKEDGSPVTKADMKAERIIRQGLLRAFPDLRILSEETIDNRSRL